MSERDDGGPAFPVVDGRGMSLRDYFAAASLKGMRASVETIKAGIKTGTEVGLAPSEVLSQVAYGDADAMLRERKL